MLLLSFILVFLLGVGAGWFERDIRRRLRVIEVQQIAHFTRHKRAEADDPGGIVVEPIEDPVAAAKAEFEARSKRLNQ